MHIEVEKLIDLVSRGDTITQRQREIIRSRAQTLGEDPDEAEILLESKLVQRDRSSTTSGIGRRRGSYDYHDSGCIYEGEMENGVAEGEGVIYYPHQYGTILYKGEFHSGNRHGRGTMYLKDGGKKCYEGLWKDDKMDGEGIFFWEDGVTKMFQGEHHNGCYEGKGILFNKNGQRYYEGELRNSDYHGRGAIYRDGIKLCEGEFINGEMVRGSLFKNGIKIYDGSLPPTEEGMIRTGTRFSGLSNYSDRIFRDYLLGTHNRKLKS